MLSRIIYDTAAPVQGVDANTSHEATCPSAVQIDTIAAATTVQIQSRIHSDAAWKVEGSYTSTDGVVLLTFAVPRQHVRVVRTAGTGAVKAYAQG